MSDEDLRAQAATYRAVIEILAEYGDRGIVTWCTWQIRDNETERGHLRGNLFDAGGNPKPAYYSVQAALEAMAISRDK